MKRPPVDRKKSSGPLRGIMLAFGLTLLVILVTLAILSRWLMLFSLYPVPIGL